MQTGVVKFFSDKKGWGFITTPEGRNVFVHHNDIVEDARPHRTLATGDRVEFELVDGPKGPRAVHVVRLDG